MMGKKHFYLKLDPSVSDEIERQYNRIVRNEEYLLEKDALGSAYFFGNESDLCKCNIMACIARDTREKADAEEYQLNLELLQKALSKLKEEHPLEYAVIMSYYFSETNKTMREIGEERNISKQAVNNALKRAYAHLKAYIILYKSES